MNRTARLLGATTATLMLVGSACESADEQQPGQLPARDRILEGTPEHVFTIGRAEGESWETFSRIGNVVFDEAGNLFVLDRGNHRVVVFDRDGRFQREMGKRGEGPGELRIPQHMAVTPEGDVLVLDIGNRALVAYGPGGEFVRQVSLADIPDPPSRIHAASGGVLALSQGRQSDDGRFARVYVLPERTGEAHREITSARLPDMLEMEMRRNEMGISNLRRTPIYSPEAYLAVSNDDTAVLQSAAMYELQLFDRNGVHVRTLSRPLAPQPVTKELRDAWLADWSRTRVEMGASAELPYDPPFADVMSQVTGLRADMNGRVWVRRRALDGEENGPVDIVALSGDYIGTLDDQALPDGFGPDWRMAAIERDELGVERVVVTRMPDAWRQVTAGRDPR